MRPRALPLLLTVAFVASACGLLPADLQHELLPSQTQYKTAEAAYSVLVERHVDKPTPQQLIPGALDGVTKYLTDAKIDAAPTVDRPVLTGSVWSDFAKFAGSAGRGATALPDRRQDAHGARGGRRHGARDERVPHLLPQPRSCEGLQPAAGADVGHRRDDLPARARPADRGHRGDRGHAGRARRGEEGRQDHPRERRGRPTLTTEEVANKVKGPEGTPVTVTFLRGSSEVEFTINRARFQTPLTTSRMETRFDRLPVRRGSSSRRSRMSSPPRRAASRRRAPRPGSSTCATTRAASSRWRSTSRASSSSAARSSIRSAETGSAPRWTPIPASSSDSPSRSSCSSTRTRLPAARSSRPGYAPTAWARSWVPRRLAVWAPDSHASCPDGGLLLVTLTKMQDAKTGVDLNGPGKGVVPDRIVARPGRPAATGGDRLPARPRLALQAQRDEPRDEHRHTNVLIRREALP